MNRVLQFLNRRECPCCSQLRDIERVLELATAAAERIESAISDDICEFWIPDASRVLKPKADDEGEVGIRLILSVEPRLATINEDLAQYAIDELRRIGDALNLAADKLELAGGAV